MVTENIFHIRKLTFKDTVKNSIGNFTIFDIPLWKYANTLTFCFCIFSLVYADQLRIDAEYFSSLITY